MAWDDNGIEPGAVCKLVAALLVGAWVLTLLIDLIVK